MYVVTAKITKPQKLFFLVVKDSRYANWKFYFHQFALASIHTLKLAKLRTQAY